MEDNCSHIYKFFLFRYTEPRKKYMPFFLRWFKKPSTEYEIISDEVVGCNEHCIKCDELCKEKLIDRKCHHEKLEIFKKQNPENADLRYCPQCGECPIQKCNHISKYNKKFCVKCGDNLLNLSEEMN